MNLDEMEHTIRFYEKLTHNLANDAHSVYLEANALTLQLRGTLNKIYKLQTAPK